MEGGERLHGDRLAISNLTNFSMALWEELVEFVHLRTGSYAIMILGGKAESSHQTYCTRANI